MYSFNNNSSFCANITSSVFHNWTPFFSIHDLLPVPLLPPSHQHSWSSIYIHGQGSRFRAKTLQKLLSPDQNRPIQFISRLGGVSGQDYSTDLKPNRSKKKWRKFFLEFLVKYRKIWPWFTSYKGKSTGGQGEEYKGTRGRVQGDKGKSSERQEEEYRMTG